MYERLSKRVQGRRDEGFTLIELLIVIVILGILAAIVVFAIGQTRGDSVASACKTNWKSIELSAEAVKTKKGQHPALTNATGVPQTTTINENTPAANNPLIEGATNNNLTTPAAFANGALLKEWPKNADYALQYVPTLASGKVSTYTLTVGTMSSAGVFTAVTIPSGSTDSATAASGCNHL